MVHNKMFKDAPGIIAVITISWGPQDDLRPRQIEEGGKWGHSDEGSRGPGLKQGKIQILIWGLES